MKHKLLRMLFCAGLLVGLLTVTALAADAWTYNATDQTLTSGDGENAVTLKNVTADGEKKLTIGSNWGFTGATLDLSGTITDGNGTETYTITAIGYSAFYNCSALTSMDLSGCTGLTSIGDYAFSSCFSLNTLTLPDSLTNIGNYAFYNCSALTSMDLSGCTGLTSIGDYAFRECSALTSVDLSGCTGLKSIGNSAFRQCGLTTVDLRGCPGLTSIGDYAFQECSDLTAVELPDSLTSIGDYAFQQCGLTTVDLSGYTSLTSIGDNAFSSCFSLNTLTLPDSLTSIGNNAFELCGALTSVDLRGCTSLTSIGDRAFQSCTNLESITLPDSLESIGGNAFQACALTSVDLRGCTGLESIGDYAFNNCEDLTSVDLSGCTSLESIGNYAFSGCTGLTSVDLSGCTGLTSIGDYAFSDCGLTSVSLSGCSSLTSIGEYAFGCCENLDTVNLSGCSSLKSIGSSIFAECSNLATVNLSGCSSLTSIADDAFRYCKDLATVDLSGCSSLKSIGSSVFKECSNLATVNLSGCTSLTSIADDAFRYCKDLATVDLSGCTSLTSIEDDAFRGYDKLTSVDLSDCTSLTSIGEYAFNWCSALTSVDLSGCTSLTSIGDNAFGECIALTSVNLSGCTSLTSIGEYAFGYCEKLDTVNLSGCSSLTSIGWKAFYCCENLTSVDLCDCTGLTSIGDNAFGFCGALTSIDLPAALKSMGDNPFTYCTSLSAITVASGNKSFSVADDVLFDAGQTKLICYPSGKTGGSYTVPDTVTTIGNDAFCGCTGLTTVILPGGVTSIGKGAFYSCSSLTELVVLAQTPPSLGTDALYDDGSSLRIVVPAGSVDAYKQAAGWSSYASSIKAVEITADPFALAFGSAVQGGVRPAAQTVTVTSPDVPVTLEQPTSPSYYDVTMTSGSLSLGAAESVTFSIQPKEGLAVGAYTETLTITGRTTPGNVSVQATVNLTYSVSQPTYTVTVNASEGGTATGGGAYTEGDTVTLTATPDSGYHFDGWTVVSGTVDIQNNQFAMPAENVEIQATFTRNSSGGSSGGSTPTRTPSQQAIDKIEAAKEGSTVKITLTASKTKLDKEVFQELAGRDVTLEISLPGGVSWTVNGQDIPTDAALTDLDMGVSMDTGTIPVDVINAVTGEVGTLQLTLAHDGAFGFTLTLTAPLGKTSAGYWANLYWYNEDGGAMEFRLADRIADDGTARFPFSHASQYAIVIDTESHEPQPEPEPLPFTDVAEDAWYGEAVRFVYESGLMTGVSDTAFAPDATTSRAMIATILWRLAGSPAAENPVAFTDVAENQWYTDAVRWAASEGIVTGYGNGLFGTDDPITREQLALMLWRYAGCPILSTPMDGFSDYQDISLWAADAMSWAVSKGILQGNEVGAILPQGSASRAEVAAILTRFCQCTAN